MAKQNGGIVVAHGFLVAQAGHEILEFLVRLNRFQYLPRFAASLPLVEKPFCHGIRRKYKQIVRPAVAFFVSNLRPNAQVVRRIAAQQNRPAVKLFRFLQRKRFNQLPVSHLA